MQNEVKDTMLSKELQAEVKVLSRRDKLILMHFILDELAYEERDDGMLIDGGQYPIWSPYGAHEAANTLRSLLHQGNQHDA